MRWAVLVLLLQPQVVWAQYSGPALAPLPGSDDEPATGSIILLCDVQGAGLFVDSSFVGLLPLPGALELVAGEHRIEIQASGYQTSWKEIDVVEGEERTFNVVLVPRKPASIAPKVEPAIVLPPPLRASEDTDVALSRRLVISGGVLIGIGAAHLIPGIALLIDIYDYLNTPHETTNPSAGLLTNMLAGWVMLSIGAILGFVGMGCLIEGMKLRREQRSTALYLLPAVSVSSSELSAGIGGMF